MFTDDVTSFSLEVENVMVLVTTDASSWERTRNWDIDALHTEAVAISNYLTIDPVSDLIIS